MHIKSVRHIPDPAEYSHSLVQGRLGAMILTLISVLFSDTVTTFGSTVTFEREGVVTGGGCGGFSEGNVMGSSVLEGKIIRSLDNVSSVSVVPDEGKVMRFTLGSVPSEIDGELGEEEEDAGAEKDKEERSSEGSFAADARGFAIEESEGEGESNDGDLKEEEREVFVSDSSPPAPPSDTE